MVHTEDMEETTEARFVTMMMDRHHAIEAQNNALKLERDSSYTFYQGLLYHLDIIFLISRYISPDVIRL